MQEMHFHWPSEHTINGKRCVNNNSVYHSQLDLGGGTFGPITKKLVVNSQLNSKIFDQVQHC